MTITRRPLTASTAQSGVVLDWSSFSAEYPSSDLSATVDALIHWVKTCPRRGNLHIYLSPSPLPSSRRLQYTLQSLGVRVTLRSATLVQA